MGCLHFLHFDVLTAQAIADTSLRLNISIHLLIFYRQP